MKISTKGRYALRLMLDLARHQSGEYISLKDIADRQGVSKNYLDQIMILLKRGKFFKAVRGYQGGYKLAKRPDQYSVGDILRVTEGGISPVPCLDEPGHECSRFDDCASRQVWLGLEKAMSDYLDNITLQDILEKYERS